MAEILPSWHNLKYPLFTTRKFRRELIMTSLKRSTTISVVLFSILLAAGVMTYGQARPPVPRPSQKASVSQTIGTTDIMLTYSRPAVKGRKIWGEWPTQVAGEATLDNQNARPAGAPIVP